MLVFALLGSGCDTLLQVAGTVLEEAEPSQVEIIQGLKEALSTGTGRAVTTLAREGGYLDDPLVKIPFPEEVQFAANTLRDIGMGALVDNLVERLNRGAEKGAQAALPIFRDAIREMTFADAKNILLGGDNAATAYFQSKTRDKLVTAFSPHIRQSLDEVHATEIWTELTTRYNSIPLVRKKVDTDIVSYATDKALDGLFLKLAAEEKLIRQDPIARSSELLKKVFGYAARQQTGN
ncbi:MAG: DUF4197 domain-containing protein [Bacteroidia bacterium]